MIEFSCHSCDQSIEAENQLAGHSINCPGCGAVLLVPGDKPIPPIIPRAVGARPSRADEYFRPFGRALGLAVLCIVGLTAFGLLYPYSLIAIALVLIIAVGVRLGRG